MAKKKLKKFDTGGKKNAEVPINAANPTWLKEVTIRPEPEAPEDTYANYYLKNNPNPGLARAMFLSPLEMIAGYSQAAMMKALTGKYGEPSNKIGYEKPEGFLQHAWNFGVNSFFDPSNLAGVGLVDDIAKLGLKGAVKKSFYNTTKDIPAELPGSPNALVGSNVNPYENYFIKYNQKAKELQNLSGSKKIDVNTYTNTINNYKEELLKEIGLTKKLGSGSFGEVFELPNDASKVIKLGTPMSGGWTPELIESLKSVKQNANLAIPEQVQNFEIPSLWKNTKPSRKEALIMPNLNITNAEKLDLTKRDRYALFLKQARQLRDKGINLDVGNYENFKYNTDKNVFDIYDLNPSNNSVINPGYYMTYIRDNTKKNLLDDMMYKNGGNLNNNNTMNDLAQQVQQMMQQGATKGQVAQQLIAAVQQGQVDQESVMQIFQQLGITEQDLAQEPTPQQQVMNYGGKMMFAEGGQPSPEEMAIMEQQAMQQQAMQQQGAPQQGQPQEGGQDPMAQVMQMVQQMVQQGAKPMDVIVELLNQQVPPEAVAQVLVQMGMPQDQVVAAIQQVMQQSQQGQQNGGEPQMEGEEEESEEVEDADSLEEKTEIPDEGEHTMMKFGGQAKKLLKKAYGGKMSSKGTTTNVYRDPMDFVKDRQTNFSNAVKFNTFNTTAQNAIDQNMQAQFPSLKNGGKLAKFDKEGEVKPETTAKKLTYKDPKTGTTKEVTQEDIDALFKKKETTNMVPISGGFNPMMQQYAQQFAQNPMWGNQYLNQVPTQGFNTSQFRWPNVSVKNNNLPQNFGLVTGMAGKFENMDWRVSGAEPLTQQRGFIGRALGRDPKTIGQRIYIDWGANQPLTTPPLPGQGKEVPPMAGQKQNEFSGSDGPPSYSEWLKADPKNNISSIPNIPSSPISIGNTEAQLRTDVSPLQIPESSKRDIRRSERRNEKDQKEYEQWLIDNPQDKKMSINNDLKNKIDGNQDALLTDNKTEIDKGLQEEQRLKEEFSKIDFNSNPSLNQTYGSSDPFCHDGNCGKDNSAYNADRELFNSIPKELQKYATKNKKDWFNNNELDLSKIKPHDIGDALYMQMDSPNSPMKSYKFEGPMLMDYQEKWLDYQRANKAANPNYSTADMVDQTSEGDRFSDWFNVTGVKDPKDPSNFFKAKSKYQPTLLDNPRAYGGPTSYDIENALNVLKMAYGGFIPKARTGMGMNEKTGIMDKDLSKTVNGSYDKNGNYQDILLNKDKKESNGFMNVINNNYDKTNLAGQWADTLQNPSGNAYASTFNNSMDSFTQFLNKRPDENRNSANQSSTNTQLVYGADRGLTDQFGKFKPDTLGAEVLNPTDVNYNLSSPQIFGYGGNTIVLNGKKYEMGGEVELTDEELKNLKKLGYIVTKKQ